MIHKQTTAILPHVVLFVREYNSSTNMQVFELLQQSMLSSWRGSHPAYAPRARQHLWQVKSFGRCTDKRLQLRFAVEVHVLLQEKVVTPCLSLCRLPAYRAGWPCLSHHAVCGSHAPRAKL